ncbi:hypothetical protein [Streptomyces synnematoformans]|uniref:Secreted protein n=1 Tax=Streptomyces synnematoformans TaxID=415721 RepID=A0ABN2XD10_9ACTN
MSVLEFISSLKWPITVLLLATAGYVIVKRDTRLRAFLKYVISNHDMRMSALGMDMELTRAESAAESAAEIAAQPDHQLDAIANEGGFTVGPEGHRVAFESPNTRELRREAIEEVMRESAEWGWHLSRMGFKRPPIPEILWTEDGKPRITYGRSEHPTDTEKQLMNRLHEWQARRRVQGE